MTLLDQKAALAKLIEESCSLPAVLKPSDLAAITAADLPVFDSRVYHLDIEAERLHDSVLLVGDPGRASSIAQEFMQAGYLSRQHRGLVTTSGVLKDSSLPLTVLTSGMGTPSLEVVLNEAYALRAVDLNSRQRHAQVISPTMIRVGTSGALQADTVLGTPIISVYSVGLDNTGFGYNVPYQHTFCKQLEHMIDSALDAQIPNDSRFKRKWHSYVSMANPRVVNALVKSAEELGIDYELGITISNSGFFHNQGRQIAPISLTVPDIDQVLAALDTSFCGFRIVNMEMEASALHHLAAGMGFPAGTVCVAIANRELNTFAQDPVGATRDSTRIALGAQRILKQGR